MPSSRNTRLSRSNARRRASVPDGQPGSSSTISLSVAPCSRLSRYVTRLVTRSNLSSDGIRSLSHGAANRNRLQREVGTVTVRKSKNLRYSALLKAQNFQPGKPPRYRIFDVLLGGVRARGRPTPHARSV